MRSIQDRATTIFAGATLIAMGCLFLAPPTPSSAAGLSAVDIGQGLASNGSRYVAFKKPNGVPVVLDARKGKVRSVRGAKGCTPVDIGAGRVLLDCSERSEAFKPSRLASVKGGRSFRVRGSRSDVELTEVGRFWLFGFQVCPAACSAEFYVNRRTGARKGFSPGDSTPQRHRLLSYPDLDLNRKKLRRFKPHPNFTPSIRSYYVIAFNRKVWVTDGSDGLRIWTSAKASRRIGKSIGACCGYSRGLSIGSGRITWVRGRNLHIFELDSCQKRKIRLPGRGARVAPVKQGVVIAVRTSPPGPGARYRVKVRRIA